MAGFISYAGDKSNLLSKLDDIFIKSNKNVFVDLFCGGGSVFTSAAYLKFKTVYANDVNNDLMDAMYHCLKIYLKDPESFEQNILNIIHCPNTKEEYYKLRDTFNFSISMEEDQWIIFLELVSCSMNNYVRYNKKGEFNQTYGQRKINKHYINNMKNFLELFSKVKDKIILNSMSFQCFLETKQVKEKALYYMDPPYSNSLVKYNAWNEDDDKTLLIYIEKLLNENNDVIVSSFIKNNKSSLLIDGLNSMGFETIKVERDYTKTSKKKENTYQEMIFVKYNT
jgi:DNA adenine methylase Dam